MQAQPARTQQYHVQSLEKSFSKRTREVTAQSISVPALLGVRGKYALRKMYVTSLLIYLRLNGDLFVSTRAKAGRDRIVTR